jgi:proteic killer suppression protein
MIRSFRCPDTERVFNDLPTRAFPPDILRTANRKLQQLDQAESLGDLRQPPGNRLEALRGNRAGQWSIRINDQWRICFTWEGTDPEDVEIVDYH